MSFWGAFTGKTQKGQIKSSYNKANAQLDTSNTAAKGDIGTGLAGAKSYIDPIAKSGQAGGKLYQDTLGLNGADARGEAQGLYLSDPILGDMRQLIKRQGQLSNSGGGYNSGAAALADSRVMGENYGSWQNRLAGQQQLGAQMAGLGAQAEMGAGNAQAGREMSYGSARAGSDIGRGAALAANANTGVNNLFKVASLGVSAATGMPVGAAAKPDANGWTTTTTKANPLNPMTWFS